MVLLILAGISIYLIMGDNGIIAKAQKAKLENRGAAVEEARNLWLNDIQMDQKTGTNTAKSLEAVVEELVNQNLLTQNEKDIICGNEEKGIAKEGKITIGSRKIVFEELRLADIAQIGDYVEYEPETKNASYYVSSSYSGYRTRDLSGINYTLTQEEFRWRIFNIDNTTGKVTLISDKPSESLFKQYYQGGNQPFAYNSYNNIVFLLNNVCEKLYSNSKYGIARSINLEDIENCYDENKIKEAKENSNYGSVFAIKYNEEKNYPIIALKEENIIINGKSGSGLNPNEQDKLYTGYDTGTLKSYQNYYPCNFEKNSFNNEKLYDLICCNGNYYIATRCIYNDRDVRVYFGCFYKDGNSLNYNPFLNQANEGGGIKTPREGIPYRPIIELNTDVCLLKGEKNSNDAWELDI